MEKQYCKVGTVTPIASKGNLITLLEYQYKNFMEKASNLGNSDSKLVDFFEQKALRIQKSLENLV